MQNFKTLKEFFIQYKWKYALGVLWLLIVDLAQLLVPQILRTITNLLEAGELTNQDLVKYCFYMIMAGLFIGVGRYFWRIYINGTSRQLEYYLRNKLFNHLQTLSTNYFNKHKTGDLMAHATNDVNAVRMALGPGIVMLTDAFFITLSTIYAMIRTANLRLTLIALLPLPFLAFMVMKFGKMIHGRFKNVQDAFSKLTDKVQENFAGVRVIKSFVQEEKEIGKFTDSNQHNFKMNIDLIKVWGAFSPLIQFISAISFLIVIWYGGMAVINNEISLGDFIALNSYIALLVWPIMAIGWVINIFQRGIASMERLNSIFNEKPEIVDAENPLELDNINGDIEYKNVSFKYPGSSNYALKNISIKVKSGNTLAIIGRTGSGKTTLVNLLIRLYDIDEGSILVDGNDLKNISLITLRENIGYVPQESFLFSTSISENIGFSFEEEIDEERIIKASRLSELYNNVVEFPQGFNTILGERGVTLSGGQKQRTSIARAIIKYPGILILDDSLSAVDTQTEERILENLREIMKSRTTIIISHRISTIKNADEIIVLDNGEIVERGKHEVLVGLGGIYKNIYEKQLLEDKIQNLL
ncbi:ATP-binding cassette, subfamily B [Proteiniborus ethanoligenes]|uniref:ATP-binding cassette, subfamily B n=1 Tax=Proteiniborus ethanoligenes TaxID=415015 RepID=A0A1H3LAH2_9FIRM|nr:ABC transporter ATP-binding protein [Proteiniborus ethanoligenes]SDY61381.1 ATP-binding cassette, subfamily B [Proteiniborus ethanoligenes]